MSARRIPRPTVLRDVPLDRHGVIDASAGTGKTYTLEHLVVELLLEVDVTIDQLLILTFTDKATHELRMRVRAKLEEFDAWRAVPAVEAARPVEDDWVLDPTGQARLARAMRAFDGATITTIHAFCERVLRENAFASGRLFDERPIDGRDAFARAVRETLRREAADSNSAPWLEAALRSGWSVPDMDGLLWECAQAHGALRPELDVDALVSGIQRLPVDEIRRIDWAAELKGYVHASRARSLQERLRTLASIVERARHTRDVADYVAEADRAKVRLLIDQLGSTSIPSGTASRVCAAALALARSTPTFCAALVQVLLPAVERASKRNKRGAGRYDFDDMLSLVDDALHGSTGRALAREMRRRWRYVLIDEFQDTDETQWSIFRRAFVERGPSDPPGAVFLVGDPKQSIYRFRGADVQTYVRARDEVLASGGRLVALRENYRATASLVAATNTLFDPAAADPLFSAAGTYRPVTCGRPERVLVDGDGNLLSPVHVLRFRGELSQEALGAAIAHETRIATDPARPWKLGGRPLQLHDVFVLTRSAREGKAIGAALREAKVPYAFFKEDGLFQTDQARDLRILLAAVDDPDDRARRIGAWLTPFFGLNLAMLEQARDLPIGHPFVDRLRAWNALAQERSFDQLFDSIVHDSGMLRREIFFGEGQRALTNTLHIVDVLLERSRDRYATLHDLNSELGGLIAQTRSPSTLEGNVQRLCGDRSAVQIMTIHKAKG
ncbi:MAG TPA: UvrD-helicase domain-containing protein, partial [Polyangiaceae bacterium]|nr:UvrD-helicase domain-containing protein [Polyangiaceae bacterium]